MTIFSRDLPESNVLDIAAKLASRAKTRGALVTHTPMQRAVRFLTRKGILTHGIESVECAGRSIDYINRGDTYDRTVVREGSDYSVSSWGDWFENAEEEHCEDDNVIRCGYCGEFTERTDCADWHDIVCAHCGHNVGG